MSIVKSEFKNNGFIDLLIECCYKLIENFNNVDVCSSVFSVEEVEIKSNEILVIIDKIKKI